MIKSFSNVPAFRREISNMVDLKKPKPRAHPTKYLYVHRGNNVYACLINGRLIRHAPSLVDALRCLRAEAIRRGEYKRGRPCLSQSIQHVGTRMYALFQKGEFVKNFESIESASDYAEIMGWYSKQMSTQKEAEQ
jgi:hypothetical protein